MSKWKLRFMDIAHAVASWSKDPSTRVGCVIVGPDRQILTTGYNGFPRGIEDAEHRLHDREMKYKLTVHAELNAVIQAARTGVSLNGCDAYVTFPPCPQCVGALIQAGIRRVYYPADVDIPDRWRESLELGASMLVEAGVELAGVE